MCEYYKLSPYWAIDWLLITVFVLFCWFFFGGDISYSITWAYKSGAQCARVIPIIVKGEKLSIVNMSSHQANGHKKCSFFLYTSLLSKSPQRTFLNFGHNFNETPALYACQLSYDSIVMILRKIIILWFTISWTERWRSSFPSQNALCDRYLNNRRTGKDATKPRTLGLLGHSELGARER